MSKTDKVAFCSEQKEGDAYHHNLEHYYPRRTHEDSDRSLYTVSGQVTSRFDHAEQCLCVLFTLKAIMILLNTL